VISVPYIKLLIYLLTYLLTYLLIWITQIRTLKKFNSAAVNFAAAVYPTINRPLDLINCMHFRCIAQVALAEVYAHQLLLVACDSILD